MKTVLLEGDDLTGKTTLMNLVEDRLSSEGFQVRTNSGPVNPDAFLVNFSLRIADSLKIPSIQEVMYTISLIADSSPRKKYTEDFFIQERSFPSVMAYSTVFNSIGINRYFGRYLRKAYSSFDYNFLIRADIESKLNRIQEREYKSKLDLMVEKDPEKIIELDVALQKILSRERNYLEINTTTMTPEEACSEIVRRIK